MSDDNQPLEMDDLSIMEAALGADFPDVGDSPDAEVTTPDDAAGITPSPQAEQQQETQGQAQDQPTDPSQAPKPDGPGDLRVALRQEREARRQMEARLQQFEQQQQAERARAEAEAFNEQVSELALTDPDQAMALIQQREAAIAQRYQAEAQQREVQARVQLSLDYARRNIGEDFDRQIARLHELGPALDWTPFNAAPDPAMAAYEWAQKNLAPDVEALRASIKAEVLAELKPQLTPAKPQAAPTLRTIPAAASNEAPVDLNSLTKRDYQKHGLDLLDLIG